MTIIEDLGFPAGDVYFGQWELGQEMILTLTAEHDCLFEPVTVAPTCGAEGYTAEECSYDFCHNQRNYTALPATGEHVYANGYDPEIRGFCWMQGEADACDATTNALYGGRYDALVRDFKAAFPTYTESCVFADAGVSTTWPFYREMNAFKAEYAATHENCVYVDTIGNGLTTAHEPEPQNDPYHYDVNSTIDLGHLFVQAVMEGRA